MLYTVKNIVAVLLAVVMLFNVIIYKKVKISFYSFWSIGFVLICLVSTLWAPDTLHSLFIAKGSIEIAVIGFLFLSQEHNYKKIELYEKAIAIAGVFLAIRIIIEFPISWWGISRLHNENLNANSIGMLLMLSTFCAYHLYKINLKKRYLLLLAPFIIIILLTGSRKAYIGVILGLVFLWWLHIKKRQTRNMLLPLAILIIFVFFVFSLNIQPLYNLVGYRLEGTLNLFADNNATVDDSTILRIQMLKVGWQLFQENPLIGHGLYSYGRISGFRTYSHNNYLELLTSVGLIGTIWYYSIYIYNIKKVIKLVKLRDKHACLFLCFFVIQLMLDFAYVSWNSESIHLMTMFSTCYLNLIDKGKNGIKIHNNRTVPIQNNNVAEGW